MKILSAITVTLLIFFMMVPGVAFPSGPSRFVSDTIVNDSHYTFLVHQVGQEQINGYLLAKELRGLKISKQPASSGVKRGEYWGLIIGINEYQQWDDLHTAVHDARTIETTLIDKYGFDSNRIISLYNHQATRKKILRSFRNISELVKKNDSLMIYFAGHGYVDKITGYWIPTEAASEEDYIPNSIIRDMIRAIDAKHILIVADSCFAGSLFSRAISKPRKIDDAYIARVADLSSRQAITSGNIEPVTDQGYEGHSIFAYYFIKALRDNRTPYLMASSLFDRIRVPVARNSLQTPICKHIQNAKDEGGEFIFISTDDMGVEPKTIPDEKMTKSNKLVIKSQPPNAMVFLNNTMFGNAPLILVDLAPGVYSLLLVKSGYSPFKKDIAVNTETDLEIIAELVKIPEDGKMFVSSKPSGANVYIDDVFKGITDCHITEIKAGQHTIRIEKEGYITVNRKIDVTVDKIVPERFVLEPVEVATHSGNILEAIVNNNWGMAFKLIPAGEFIMGSNSLQEESPKHKVVISRPFYIQITEVSQKQWSMVMGGNPSKKNPFTKMFHKESRNPKHFDFTRLLEINKSHPVASVSWNDAQRFVDNLNKLDKKQWKYRLPTEAEWEYACRAGNKASNFMPNHALKKYAWFSENSGGHVRPIKKKAPNPWGLYDMFGNVAEWCQDYYGKYPSHIQIDPRGPDYGNYRISRGGHFNSGSGSCRPSSRGYHQADIRDSWLGLRIIVEPN